MYLEYSFATHHIWLVDTNLAIESAWSQQCRIQYVGPVRTPVQIGWMTRSGSFTYDFRSERVSIWEGLALPGALRGAPRSLFEDLVHTWERIVLAPSQRHRVD